MSYCITHIFYSSNKKYMKPIVAYDASCAFCTKAVSLLEKMDSNKRLTYKSIDDFLAEHPELYSRERETRTQTKNIPDGLGFSKEEKISWGADAVYSAVNELPCWRVPAQLYRVPGLKQVARAAYAFIAKNRYIFGTCEGACRIK